MKHLFVLMMVLMFSASGTAWASDNNGLISKKSLHGVSQTLDRLEKILKKNGIRVIARVDHEKGGKRAGIPLRPTELLLFANPALGTNFFTSNQTAGIDLPMKALAWEDANGQVWLTYNDPQYLADRHGITDRAAIVKKMTNALDKMTTAATGQ